MQSRGGNQAVAEEQRPAVVRPLVRFDPKPCSPKRGLWFDLARRAFDWQPYLYLVRPALRSPVDPGGESGSPGSREFRIKPRPGSSGAARPAAAAISGGHWAASCGQRSARRGRACNPLRVLRGRPAECRTCTVPALALVRCHSKNAFGVLRRSCRAAAGQAQSARAPQYLTKY